MTPRRRLCGLVNSVWLKTAMPDYLRFMRSLGNCSGTQENYLLRLLRRNVMCLHGREHGFGGIKSVQEFQKRMPITQYKDYSPYIRRIADGEKGVLTTDPVRMFEPSSGTSSGEKLIPYTEELNREFRRAINPWIVSLNAICPGAFQGRAYWSISPSLKPDRRTHGIIPVGFDNDWSYLGGLGKLLYSNVAVVPSIQSQTDDTTHFRNSTLAALLAADDLSLASIWSPSFLRLMLDWYIVNKSDVLALVSSSRHGRERARFLDGLQVDDRDLFRHVWPDLKVVSCWTDASSTHEALRLSERLPHAHIQGKGLVSTESFVSFPLLPGYDPVLAIRSHFFEFMDAGGEILLAHQLKTGQEYSVIVTTGGGLYRYCTGDRVLVTGSVGSVPTVRFLGRTGLVSDRYGEKLDASHVSAVIATLFAGADPDFAMLAPDRIDGAHSYTLYIKSDRDPPENTGERLDQLLKQNPNYRYCRGLGQLYPPRIFRLDGDPVAVYEEELVVCGIGRGDIKLSPLSKMDNWSRCFSGEYQEET